MSGTRGEARRARRSTWARVVAGDARARRRPLLPRDAAGRHADPHGASRRRALRTRRSTASRRARRRRSHAHAVQRRAACASSTPARVGMPYEGEVAAFWALVDDDVEFRKTPFDVERAVADIRASGWPTAEEFVIENLLGAVARRDDRVLRVACLTASPSVASGKPHGIKGAFFVEHAKRRPGALRRRRAAVRRRRAGRGRRVEARGRPPGDPARPRAARAARRSRSTRAALPAAGPDEYYVFQLVGLDVTGAAACRSAA